AGPAVAAIASTPWAVALMAERGESEEKDAPSAAADDAPAIASREPVQREPRHPLHGAHVRLRADPGGRRARLHVARGVRGRRLVRIAALSASAADLKFLRHLRQACSGTSNRKAALEP